MTSAWKSCLSGILLALICVRAVLAYSDPEIEKLLSSLSDPYCPSLEDYRLIENYYQFGERPYIDQIRKDSHIQGAELDYRIQQLRNFKLVGPNGEMPIREVHALNVTEETKDRCILIYASYNAHYPQRARRLLQELKERGYSGHVILRVGGFPNISNRGAKLCTIPYTFRLAFFHEALEMGFTKILYLDATLHPLNDLSTLFSDIDQYGYFSCHMSKGWFDDCFAGHAKFLGIPFEQKAQIPWVLGYATGLDFTNEKTRKLFEAWEDYMHRIDEFCFIGDDIVFTCLIWSFNFPQPYPFDKTIAVSDFEPAPGSFSNSMLFYMDCHKTVIREGWGSLYD